MNIAAAAAAGAAALVTLGFIQRWRVHHRVHRWAEALPPANWCTLGGFDGQDGGAWSLDAAAEVAATRPPADGTGTINGDGLAAGAADALLGSLDELRAFLAIDPTVVAAMDFWLNEDLASFNNLQAVVAAAQEMGPEAYANWFTTLQGYVGELVAADVLREQGFDVAFPDTPNNPGWDLLINGQPFNVKVGTSTQHILEHFERYPDIPVITSTELAERLPEELQGQVLALDELDHDAIAGLTQRTLEGVAEFDFAPSFPVVTALVSAWREVRLLWEGKTDGATSLKNLGLDILGTGGGGFLGAKLGAALGTLVSPGAGTLAGALLFGVLGSMTGRSITNGLKEAAYRQAVEAYEKARKEAQGRLEEAHRAAVRDVQDQVRQAQLQLRRELDEIERARRGGLLAAKGEWEERVTDFVSRLPQLLLDLERVLGERERAVLAGLPRSPLLVRLFFPKEQDIRYRAVQLWFAARRAELRAAARRMASLRDRPAEEALREVQEYLADKVWDFPPLIEAVRAVTEEYQRTLVRCSLERALAEREARAACAERAAQVQRYMANRLEALRQECQGIQDQLRALLRRVEAEAAKLGWR